MKKLLLSAAMLLFSLLTFAQYSGSGNGTEEDPYLIFNETQLSQVSNFLNQEGVVFKLMKDLDLTNWIEENNPNQGWLPIGVESSPFKGVFHGNNHKITGLMIKRTSTNHVGFFGYVSGITIENLTIEGSSVVGNNFVGVLAGSVIGSTINNCHVIATENYGVKGGSYVGGFAGYSNNTSFNSFSVSVSVTSSEKTGGMIGFVENGMITDGTASGAIVGTGNYTGGLIGQATGCTLSNINVKSTITGQDYSGGLMGYCATGDLTNCTFEGDLTGKQYVGGMSGSLEIATTSLIMCSSKGKITSTNDYVGGIIGVSKGGCIEIMEDCWHFGNIEGENYVGGLIGAILDNSTQPTLHTYTVHNGENSYIYQTTNEQIVNGNTVYIPINNCAAIGNIIGNNCIGGMIGLDSSAIGYNKNSNTASYASGFDKWLYKDGIYTGVHKAPGNPNTTGLWTTLTYSYYNYTRHLTCNSVTNSYYSGTIHGTNNVGGLIGYKSGGTLQNNYTYANIYGSSNVGGIVGQISAELADNSSITTTIKSNVSVNSIISAVSSNIGRIYGTADLEHTTVGALASAECNRALTQTKVLLCGIVQEVDDDIQNGTSVGPSTLKLKANYVSWGWNFDENWNILETECYPYKKYQAAPPVIESNLVSQATAISGKSTNGGTVFLYYKDSDAVSTTCNGFNWSFVTEPLQSGALVQIYADVEGMTPSYFTTTTVGYPGSGTEADPWRIYTAEDLQGVCNKGYYKVMNDIDLTQWINENSPEEGWPAIGRNSGETTYIDGDNHTISGLWTNTTENYNGLFSNFSAGCIKNLNVEVAAGKNVKGGDYTGILIGRNANGRLENCSVKGDVEGTMHVGGIAGYVESTVVDALVFDGTVSTVSNNAFVGSIAGQMKNCTVTSCNAESEISTSGSNNKVGGLVGESIGGTISKSSINCTISATGADSYVGGMVGYSNTPITLSKTSGSVSTTGGNSYTGGLVGYALASVENCYSVTNTTGSLFTAGLIGYTFSTIGKCYAQGDIMGVKYGAGLVGELDGPVATITNSIACNNILSLSDQASWGSRVLGGFKNGAADPDESNYALASMQVSLNNVPQIKTDDLVEGIAKTEIELKQKDTYTELGWDFDEIWTIDEGQAYPRLRWESDVTPDPSDVLSGDVNNDEDVNVTDYITLANYILGQSIDEFNETAADVNEDGSVNVSDYVGVANIILYGRYTGQAANSIKALSSESSSTWLEAQNGEDGQLTLQLHDAKAFVAFQMDIQLPEGVTIKEATMAKANQTPNLGVANLGNGTWRLLYGTLTNKDVKLNDGNLLTLQLTTNETYMGGSLIIDNIFLTKANTNTQQLDAILAGLPTGIRSIENGLATRTIYDLTGRKVEKMQRGIYIVNGKKVSVK